MTIVVAGHTGLVGSAILELLEEKGQSVVGVNSSVVDLLNRKSTFDFMKDLKPEIVIDAAAIAGGIGFNNSKPVNFISNNLQIQTNIMDASFAANVERFIFLGSSCIYPRECPQPIKEEYLMTGKLEATNSAYAVAKIAGIEMIKAYRRQYGKKWISLMPTNIYGPRDNFNEETAHVIPALISKFIKARDRGDDSVQLWGSGSPRREFLHSSDLAEAIYFSIENFDSDDHLNVGSGTDVTIKELSVLIADYAGFKGQILWDQSKPDGTPRKLLDISRIMEIGWSPKISLSEGIHQTIDWYEENRDRVRS